MNGMKINGSANGYQQSNGVNGSYQDHHDDIDAEDQELAYLVRNLNLKPNQLDILYHFGLSTEDVDFKSSFGDVKFVLTGGSTTRMRKLAEYLTSQLDLSAAQLASSGINSLQNLSRSDRYVMYKVGPVLCINHGMGCPSLSIMLHETFKLLHHAGCKDVTFIRIGSSGGIGVEPGTVVVTNKAVNGLLEPVYEMDVLGVRRQLPALISTTLADQIYEIAVSMNFKAAKGATMCANDFYEGQARLDGSVCSITKEQKLKFLQRLYSTGVRNIEMESVCFAAMTHAVGVNAAIVCCTLLNRLEGDQVTLPKSEYQEFETRPLRVVAELITRSLRTL